MEDARVYDKTPTNYDLSRSDLPLNVDFLDDFLSPALNDEKTRELDETEEIKIELLDLDSAELKRYNTEFRCRFRGPKWRVCGLRGWRTYVDDRRVQSGDTLRFSFVDAANLVLGVRRIPPPAAATASAAAADAAAAPPPAPVIDLPPGASVAVPPGISITLPPGSALTFPIGRPVQIPPGAGLTLPPGTGIILPPGAVLITASEGEPEPESAPSPVVDPETENSPVAEPVLESSLIEPDPVVEPEPDLPPLNPLAPAQIATLDFVVERPSMIRKSSKRLDLRKVHGNLDLLD